MKNLFFFFLFVYMVIVGCLSEMSHNTVPNDASAGTPQSRLDSINSRWINIQMGKFYPVQVFHNDTFAGMGAIHQDGFCFTARHVAFATGKYGEFTAIAKTGQKFLLNRHDAFEQEIALAIKSNIVFDVGFLISVDSINHMPYQAYDSPMLQSGSANYITPQIQITSVYSGEKARLIGGFKKDNWFCTAFCKRNRVTLKGESGSVWLFDNDPQKIAILTSDGFVENRDDQITFFTISALPDGHTSW